MEFTQVNLADVELRLAAMLAPCPVPACYLFRARVKFRNGLYATVKVAAPSIESAESKLQQRYRQSDLKVTKHWVEETYPAVILPADFGAAVEAEFIRLRHELAVAGEADVECNCFACSDDLQRIYDPENPLLTFHKYEGIRRYAATLYPWTLRECGFCGFPEHTEMAVACRKCGYSLRNYSTPFRPVPGIKTPHIQS